MRRRGAHRCGTALGAGRGQGSGGRPAVSPVGLPSTPSSAGPYICTLSPPSELLGRGSLGASENAQLSCPPAPGRPRAGLARERAPLPPAACPSSAAKVPCCPRESVVTLRGCTVSRQMTHVSPSQNLQPSQTRRSPQRWLRGPLASGCWSSVERGVPSCVHVSRTRPEDGSVPTSCPSAHPGGVLCRR